MYPQLLTIGKTNFHFRLQRQLGLA